MDDSMSEKKILRLDSPVVVRKVPMTAMGSDLLRAIRDFQTEAYKKQTGQEVVIPYPVAIHMALADYCKLKGIKPK